MSDPGAPVSSVMRTDPSRLARLLGSRAMRLFASARARELARRLAEGRRRLTGAPHRVEYFHQVDDAYSHLAAQTLARLTAAYEIELVCHLVGSGSRANVPEPELLATYARKDAADVAPYYGLTFPRDAAAPPPEQVRLAERILTGAAPDAFAALAVDAGAALWADDKEALGSLAATHPTGEDAARARVAAGTARREKLGHYSGAMFHYAGEWYWGVDRLHHLERRLDALGARRPEAKAPVAPRPPTDPGPVRDTGRIELEFFPSLRSPYTAIAYDATLALAERVGVKLSLRPVMPMVMRGVPATLAKGRYIVSDAAREAELEGVPFGRIVDPIGEPVERGFSLFPWARERGRAEAFLSAFLRGAFAEGIDTSTEAGLRTVVERAGLPWSEARAIVGNEDWRDELEANRIAMYEELGLWGVPSYRILGPEGSPDFATWGQDRLWRVAAELRARLAAR